MLLMLVLASYDCDYVMHPPEPNIVVVGACSWDNDGTGVYSFASVVAGVVISQWYVGACLMIVMSSIMLEWT